MFANSLQVQSAKRLDTNDWTLERDSTQMNALEFRERSTAGRR